MTVREFKLQCPREDVVESRLCDVPERSVAFIREHAMTSPLWRADVENLGVLLMSVRLRVEGYLIISTGTLDTVLAHPREVFRPALIAGAHSIILFHNHPSGDPIPSEADVRVTRDLIRAGQVLRVAVLDHLIVGRPSPERSRDYVSLKELGYFHGIFYAAVQPAH